MKRILMTTRKIMVENGIYHITQRAPGRELLFIEEDDYLYFLSLLKKTSQEFLLDTFCFVLLPNHLHILLRIKEKNLDKAMKFLFQTYAQDFNKKYQRKGHVFCGVYRAALCRDEKYLIAISLYIHLNPFKAGLTEDVFSYRWFSLDPYIKPIKSTFLKSDFILNLLDKEENKARVLYKNLIEETVNLEYKNILEDSKAVNIFYEGFIKWIRKNTTNLPFSKSSSFGHFLELEEELEKIQFKKRKRSPQEEKGYIYLIQQLRLRGYIFEEISEKIGVSRTTLYRLLKANETKLIETEM